ncbi:MAG: HYR domain-containing protein, partial [Acidobacteria bacterium]|nr:HYR domain-containing protein [Acidobacteriota bacterium]
MLKQCLNCELAMYTTHGKWKAVWNNNCAFFANGLKFTYDDEDPDCYNLCADYDDGNRCKPLACAGPGTGSTDFLVKFDGENTQGTWRLKAVDGVGGDVGTINQFKLEMTYITLAAPGFTVPSVYEACCFDKLTYSDSYVDEDCSTGLSKTLKRKWTARDCSGNTSTWVQTIQFVRPILNSVSMPVDYDGVDAAAFQCTDNAYPSPDWIEARGLQGYPWVFGFPEGCNIDWEYEDLRVDVCDGTYKIRREWTVIDWCSGDGFTYNQIIKVMDNAAPTMACPANMTVSVDPFTCCAFVNLPDVVIEDNCSRINNISGMIVTFEPFTGEQTGMLTFGGSVTDFPGNNYWDLDTLGAFGWTPCLPQGTHTVTYVAEDDCGNTATCSFRLTVRDYIPPVAACDETTTIAIGVDDPFDCYGPAGPNGTPNALGSCDFAGVTWVKATTFDDGSYDQCNGVDFTIRRQAPYSDCILGLNATNGFSSCSDIFPDVPSEFERAISEADSIKFYCCEVGTTQTIVLRVYQVDVNGVRMVGADGSPIFNECQIQVQVQDKIKPVCVSPSNYTVTCEQFDPSLWLYGKATVSDNCCLDQTKNYLGQCGLTHTVSYTNFDTLCNKGTIVRTFRAFDCHGQSSQCTQRIVVNYEQDYFVRFPDDKIVSVC